MLRDGEQVIDIIPGKHCTVITNKGRYTAESLIITPGTTERLLKLKPGLHPNHFDRGTEACAVQNPINLFSISHTHVATYPVPMSKSR